MGRHFDTGDTAWLLVSAALVLLMTPGLAFFYGGMVRARSVLNMLMMSFASIGVVSVLWMLFGYSVAFGHASRLAGLWGGLDAAGLGGLAWQPTVNGATYPVPALAFVAFQLMFAVITPAVVSGAIADRARFGTWLAFVAVWVSLCYFPVAHWVFDLGDAQGRGAGWLAGMGVLDFAGGTAVHVNAGAAGLALALVLGRRLGWRQHPMHPHSRPLVMLGTGLLWFGWFGFNAGSALAAGSTAAVVFLNTQLAAASAVLGWMLVERLRGGHYTSLGAASGAVSGLVAITPGCAFVSPAGGCALGAVSGAACALAVSLKWRVGLDDSLDVVAVHLVGGALGSVALGFLAVHGGLLYGGGPVLLGKQVLAVMAVGGFSFVLASAIGKALDVLVGFRVPAHHERAGIDLVAHGETGYHWDTGQPAGPRGTRPGLPGVGPVAGPESVVPSALGGPATLDA